MSVHGMEEFFANPRGEDADEPVAFEVRITDNASDPADEIGAQELFGNQHHYDSVRWSPRPGPTYPQRGDTGLLILSDAGNPWLVMWSP